MVKYKVISLSNAIKLVKVLPPAVKLWWGIELAPGVYIIMAKPKMGKSIFGESFVIALLNKYQTEFLGMPITTLNLVVILSFEEMMILRTLRNIKQLEALDSKLKEEILDKFFVFDDESAQFVPDNNGRIALLRMLMELQPQVIIIDSLGRLGVGQIEDSRYSQELMLFVREIAKELNCPVIVLHHTVKTKKGDNVELATMAGSRLIGQEADGVLTIIEGKEPGVKIIKPVAWRYHGDYETEIHFKITENCLVEHVRTVTNDGNTVVLKSDSNFDKLKAFIDAKGEVFIHELLKEFVDTNVMSRSTLFTLLGKKPIVKVGPGKYSLIFNEDGPTEIGGPSILNI